MKLIMIRNKIGYLVLVLSKSRYSPLNNVESLIFSVHQHPICTLYNCDDHGSSRITPRKVEVSGGHGKFHRTLKKATEIFMRADVYAAPKP
jgi:hypothetical protein